MPMPFYDLIRVRKLADKAKYILTSINDACDPPELKTIEDAREALKAVVAAIDAVLGEMDDEAST